MTAAPADAPAPAITFDRPGQLERPSADWERDDAGRPWLLPDPEWDEARTAAWLGARGRDGRVPYTRVTTFVEALLDGTMLAKWKMRRVALGMGRRPDYVVAAAGLTADDRDRKALNDLAEKALEASGPNAADIGTAMHQFSERIDRGEPLGFVPEQYRADLDAYREQVQRIRWLHREERMVCDRLETAGTPDGLGYVDEPDPDGAVDLLRVIDLKTGNVETTAGKFSAQLGVYANSALYDARTGQRTWLADLDRRWGVVLHMPAGLGTAELRWLNLEHGWLGAQLAGPVRKWRTVNWADLMRPLVAPAPRTVEPGRCAGRKRDGEPCTYKAVSGGFCGRHQDQVGTDPDAVIPVRVTETAAVLTAALEDVPEPLRTEQPATVVLEDDALLDRLDEAEHPSTAVEQPVDDAPDDAGPDHGEAMDVAASIGRCATTDLLVEQCACPVHRPDLATTGDDGVRPDEPREMTDWARRVAAQQAEPEQNGNPTPRAGLRTPEDAEEAARKAELALMDSVRACRTAGELDVLWQRTGQAWTEHVKGYAVRHRKLLPELSRRERVDAALLGAIAACRTLPELQALGRAYPAEQWTDEAKAAARTAAAQLPPF